MIKATPIATFVLYTALKLHFTTTSYDFFRYNGKVKVTNFNERKDRFFFTKISNLYDESDLRDFFISNLLKDKKWIGEFLSDDAEENLKEYQKRKQSLSYIFGNDLDRLGNIKESLQCKDDTYPGIIQALIQQDISLETFTILEHYIQFSNKFDRVFGENDIFWAPIRTKIMKYYPFIEYDDSKMRKALKERISNNGRLSSEE